MINNYYESNLIIHTRIIEKIMLVLDDSAYKAKDFIKHVDLFFHIQSKIENRKIFIIMLILIEKLSNQKVTFILDKNTLSKKRVIKVGCKVRLRNIELYNFLQMSISSALPKLLENNIIFHFKKSTQIAYHLKKVLFHSIFGYDSDFDFFYDYFDAAIYSIEVNFRTVYNNPHINRLILSQYGFNMFI